MPPDLDDLLVKLKSQPLDRSLDGVGADIDAQLVDRAAANAQTWMLRAAAALFVAAGGAIATASMAAAAPEPASPFEAWSDLAPSTLLESAG